MRTKCSRGHKFTPENTYERIDRKRGCITCRDIAFGIAPAPVPTLEQIETLLRTHSDSLARSLKSNIREALSTSQILLLQHCIDDLNDAIDEIFYKPQVGDEVSVKYDDDYYEESHITEVKGDRVFLDDHNNRSYDIQTGKLNWRTYGCRNLHDITVIYDNGYAFQHWEDLSLGEGDTL